MLNDLKDIEMFVKPLDILSTATKEFDTNTIKTAYKSLNIDSDIKEKSIKYLLQYAYNNGVDSVLFKKA